MGCDCKCVPIKTIYVASKFMTYWLRENSIFALYCLVTLNTAFAVAHVAALPRRRGLASSTSMGGGRGRYKCYGGDRSKKAIQKVFMTHC